MEVRGWSVGGESHLLYMIRTEGLTIAVLGSLEKEIKPAVVEAIGGVDIVFIDLETDMGSKSLWEQVRRLGPNLVLPFSFDNQEDPVLEGLLDEADRENVESVAKIKVDRSSLPQEEGVIVVLNG